MTCKISPKMTFLKVEYDMCVYVDKYVDYVEKIKSNEKTTGITFCG